MKTTIIVLAALAIFMSLSACEKKRIKTERETIEAYIAENNLDAQSTDEGVYYVVEQEGNGTSPTAFDEVEVHYEGFLLDGTKFDSSIDRNMTATLSLQRVIKGWQYGFPQFSEGGRGILIIPSRHAYGKNPPPNSPIGKNEILVFNIRLFDVL